MGGAQGTDGGCIVPELAGCYPIDAAAVVRGEASVQIDHVEDGEKAGL